MLYLTDQFLYFYSPFNPNTLIGKGSKLRIAYSEIQQISKQKSLLVFPDAIKITLIDGGCILLRSFVSRDTCYSFILSRLMSFRGPDQVQQQNYSRAIQVAMGVATRIKKQISWKQRSSKKRDNSPTSVISSSI